MDQIIAHTTHSTYTALPTQPTHTDQLHSSQFPRLPDSQQPNAVWGSTAYAGSPDEDRITTTQYTIRASVQEWVNDTMDHMPIVAQRFGWVNEQSSLELVLNYTADGQPDYMRLYFGGKQVCMHHPATNALERYSFFIYNAHSTQARHRVASFHELRKLFNISKAEAAYGPSETALGHRTLPIAEAQEQALRWLHTHPYADGVKVQSNGGELWAKRMARAGGETGATFYSIGHAQYLGYTYFNLPNGRSLLTA